MTKPPFEFEPQVTPKTFSDGVSIMRNQPWRRIDAVAIDGCKATTETLMPPAIVFEGVLTDKQVTQCHTEWKARTENPHTSHEAAATLSHLARKHRAGCLAALALYGPQTGHEIAKRLGLGYDQVSKRLPELMRAGTIERRKVGGLYRTRKTPSGRTACVWYVVGTP